MKTKPTARDFRSRRMLEEIFAENKPGEAGEAFGDDFFLLNMSSRVNAQEGLTDEQHVRIQEIWIQRAGRE
jgi:hypothetical protein